MKFYSLIICCIGYLFFAGCNGAADDAASAPYQQARKTITDEELANPQKFVRIIFEKKKRNLVGKSVVKFRLLNTATTVTYQDVRIKSLFYKEGQLVANHEDVYDDVLHPGDDEDEMIRYKTPRGTDSVALQFMQAKAVPYKH